MMTRFGLTLAGCVMSAPAMAHEGGAHLHPHGVEGSVLVMGAAVLMLAGAVAWWQR